MIAKSVDLHGLQIEKSDSGALKVRMETPHLVLTSLTEEDAPKCAALYDDREALKTYTRVRREDIDVKGCHDAYVTRWNKGNPISSLAIKLKDGTLIGEVMLESDITTGNAQISYLLNRGYWNKGHGEEAVTAVIQHFLPLVKSYGEELGNYHWIPEKIDATALRSNAPSVKILDHNLKRLPQVGEDFRNPKLYYQKEIEPPAKPESSWEIDVIAGKIISREKSR